MADTAGSKTRAPRKHLGRSPQKASVAGKLAKPAPETVIVRQRQQMTLPPKAAKRLGLQSGDILVVDVETTPGAITFWPADLVPRSGSIEANAALTRVSEAIDEQGRRPRFRSARAFRDHLAARLSDETAD